MSTCNIDQFTIFATDIFLVTLRQLEGLWGWESWVCIRIALIMAVLPSFMIESQVTLPNLTWLSSNFDNFFLQSSGSELLQDFFSFSDSLKILWPVEENFCAFPLKTFSLFSTLKTSKTHCGLPNDRKKPFFILIENES